MSYTGSPARRNFDTGDEATDHNLKRLDHLARQKWDGEARNMDTWLLSVIGSLKMLPKAVSQYFNIGAFMIGSQHFETNDAGRKAIWERLGRQLNDALDAVMSDTSLHQNAKPDFSDRPASKAEILMKICDELDEAVTSGKDANKLAVQLEIESAGTLVVYDAREIRKLLSKRRISDVSKHRADLYRLINHAHLVASQLHHRQ